MSTEVPEKNDAEDIDIPDAPDIEVGLDEPSEEVEEPPELISEISLGGTPAGIATNEALRALARAARSFLIYDHRNEAIRGFLEGYRKSMADALKGHGPMMLSIRPFEMLRDGEVIYLERDRERSMAFRMFRDGVRKVTIQPDAEWHELLRLLEILSIRFTGIRQQEDDIVTLLMKAGFKSIDISAVEGFVPDNEEYCGDDPDAAAARDVRLARRAESHIEVPSDWDTPVPELPPAVELEQWPVDIEALKNLHDDSSSKALADNTVKLVVEMLKLVEDPIDPTTPADVSGLFSEARDFLLSEGQLPPLLNLVRNIRQLVSDESSEEVLSSFVNARAMKRVISSVPKGQEEAPEELIELLDLIPSNHLYNLCELLETERSMTQRRMLRSLIVRYATADTLPALLERIQTADASVAADLYQICIDGMPGEGIAIATALYQRTEVELQRRVCDILEKESDLSQVTNMVFELMEHGSDEIRVRALLLLKKTGDIRLFKNLLDKLEKSADMSPKEAEAIGEVLVELNPKATQRALGEWIKPKGMFGLSRVSVRKHQKWAAVTALALLPEDSNAKYIRKIRDAAGEALANHCSKMLYKRRRMGLGG